MSQGSDAAAGKLIDLIEADALGDKRVADVLRKVVALGGHTRSERLRDWATRELKGYAGDDELPDYREVPAPICVDAQVGLAQVRGQRLSVSELPEDAREVISESVPIRHGIGEVEALVADARARGDASVRLSPPGAVELAGYMNTVAGDPLQHLTALYWQVSVPSLDGVVDQVRTVLTEFVAELRAGLPAGDAPPSRELVDQAVDVAVHGDHARVVVVAQSAGRDSDASDIASVSDQADPGGWWTRTRIVGGIVVGAATIGGAIFTYLQWAS